MKLHRVLLMAAAWYGAGALAFAADYPVRSIRYIVPQGAGGSSDTLARLVTQKLAESLGQQVVTDNRPGATGNIGTEIAARANPDGYTLLQVATSHATNPALSVKMPFDPIRDFAPITLLSQSPNLWIVHPSLPGEKHARTDCARENTARRDQLLVIGHRLVAASGGRTAEIDRAHRHRAHSVQRQPASADRSARRPGGADVLDHRASDAASKICEIARARGDQPQALCRGAGNTDRR
jgi:hypothetical protein